MIKFLPNGDDTSLAFNFFDKNSHFEANCEINLNFIENFF